MPKTFKAAGILILGVLLGIFISILVPSNLGRQVAKSLRLTRETSSSPIVDDKFNLQTYLNQFPTVREGFKRYFIPAPKNENDELWLVDILVGKYRMADCNSTSLSSVKSEFKKDWTGNSYRYYYYEIETDGKGMSTLMACPSELKFDIANNKNIPKNLSFPRRMNNEYYPIVVDINSDFEIGYRLWTTNTEVEKAELVK